MEASKRIVVIGAGIGGLAATLRLVHAGADVTVVEAQSGPGGKMRALPSAAGPVDAGPTVLTLRPVFEALFADVGLRLADHLTLIPEEVLARHYWSDGTRLDLCADPEVSAANVAAAFGPRAAAQFRRFSARAARLFDGFDGPMMQSAAPTLGALARHVLRHPALITDMAPLGTLDRLLRRSFDDPRLVQLFGRYATYVGGAPGASPALLALIWSAEARGVWRVEGGMHRLARTLADVVADRGGRIRYDTPASRIEWQEGRVAAVIAGGDRIAADAVLFNGDPRALSAGALGQTARAAVLAPAQEPRSLSAHVATFAAVPTGPDLAHHTVFFADAPGSEFGEIAAGRIPSDPTLYVCAQDRGSGLVPEGPERFEIIMNAAPLDRATATEGPHRCMDHILTRLARFGLRFSPTPGSEALATPETFATLFPMSEGAIYGRSPEGMTAAFARPTVRTPLRGLYLVGGGVHPGPGIPMATLCARHAAAAITTDLGLTSPSPRTVMPGGTSTGSATTAVGLSRSSVS